MPSVYEKIEHERLFPAKIFTMQINSCEFHWHDDYEIILVLKGKLAVYCGMEPTMEPTRSL